jgi:8-oxo-dGTP pyrophosphatase MutT (NUDIX family)
MSHKDLPPPYLQYVLCHDIHGEVHAVAKLDLVNRPAGYVVSLTEYELLVIPQQGNEVWDFPGGGCLTDETPLGAAKRELAEETGLSIQGRLQLVTAFEEFYFDTVTSQGWHSFRYYFTGSGLGASHDCALKEISDQQRLFISPVVKLISHQMNIKRLVTLSESGE